MKEMTDQALLEAYEKAKNLQRIDQTFIELLEAELKKRELLQE